MQRIWQFLLDTRTLAVIGLLALAALLFLGADTLKVGAMWAVVILVTLLVVYSYGLKISLRDFVS